LRIQTLHDADTAGFDPDPTPGVRAGFELDTVDIFVDVDASVRIFSPAVTYGVTDRLDVSLLVPIVSVDLGVRSQYQLVISPENLTPGVHDTNVLGGAEPAVDQARGSAIGVGDLVLGAKYQFVKGQSVEFAAALLAKLATGDEHDFLGSGETTLRPFLIASSTFRDVGGVPLSITPHVNLGYEFDVEHFDRSTLRYVAGFEAGVKQVTLAFEFLGSHNQAGQDRIDGAVGVKWDIYKKWVLSGNVIFPLNNTGLRSDWITTFGAGITF
jgi:hypothetical protein